jgi:hypothetical protein
MSRLMPIQPRSLTHSDTQGALLGISLLIVAVISGGFGLSSGWFGAPPHRLSSQIDLAVPISTSKAGLIGKDVVAEVQRVARSP